MRVDTPALDSLALSNMSFLSTRLYSLLQKYAATYQSASPFPHAVIDEPLFNDASMLRAVASEIPQTMRENGCVPGAAACYRKPGTHFRKSELHHDRHGPYTRALFETLRTQRFVHFLEQLSGIRGLIPDPGFQGSGVHLTGSGGILKVHHDFNFMICHRGGSDENYSRCVRGTRELSSPNSYRLHRRVNIFLYLNDDWPDHYGGHLELWNRNMSACAKRIAPTLGRFVAFSSTDFSFHGHPQPMLALPPNRMRRSIAFYYYTMDRPSTECDGGDCTTFHDARWQDPSVACSAKRILYDTP